MAGDKDCVGKYISMLYRGSNCYINKKLSKYAIGSGQYIFLLYLFKNDGANQEEICNALDIDKGTTARAIQKLEKEGYINRRISEKDKRINYIFITEKALNIKSIIIKTLNSWEQIIYDNFKEEEKDMLLELLKKASYNFQNYKTKE